MSPPERQPLSAGKAEAVRPGVSRSGDGPPSVVDPEHDAYGDPEWLADSAAGALKNIYGVDYTCGDVEDVSAEQ